MKKLKAMPRIAKEIILTVILYVALWALCYFVIKEYIIVTDESLSTIGFALSTSLGVLTAIVVSFVLIVWQTSRRDRSESFLRWRNSLHQLFDFYDTNMEKYPEIREDVSIFTQEASEVASIKPMKRQKFKELISAISDKLIKNAENLQNILNPSSEQLEKARIGKYMLDYLVMLTHANFDHNVAHNLYKGLLDLRGLLYRLLSVLIASIILGTLAVTRTSAEISDVFNTPIALILVAWVMYVLIHLGIEVKRFTRLEDEFRRLEAEAE